MAPPIITPMYENDHGTIRGHAIDGKHPSIQHSKYFRSRHYYGIDSLSSLSSLQKKQPRKTGGKGKEEEEEDRTKWNANEKKFIQQSHEVFNELQNRMERLNSNDNNNMNNIQQSKQIEVVHCSKLYRSIIKEYTSSKVSRIDLDDDDDDDNNNNNSNDNEIDRDTLQVIFLEHLWAMCHLFIFENAVTTTTSGENDTTTTNNNISKPFQITQELISLILDMVNTDEELYQSYAYFAHQLPPGQPPETHGARDPEKLVTGYWSLIYAYTLRGSFAHVEALLRHHSQYGIDNSDYQMITNSIMTLLKDSPQLYLMNDDDNNDDNNDYQEKLFLWRRSVENMQSALKMKFRNLHTNNNQEENEKNNIMELFLLFDILCGKEETLITYCETWQELLVAILLYQGIPVQNTLEYIIVHCQEIHPPDEETEEIMAKSSREMLMAVLKVDSDMGGVLKIMFTLCNNLLTYLCMTHLCDLFYHFSSDNYVFHTLVGQEGAGILEQYGIRERLFLDMSEYLMTSSSSNHDDYMMWKYALNYLSYCPIEGKERKLQYLQEIIPNSKEEYMQMIDIAQGTHKIDIKVMLQSYGSYLLSQKCKSVIIPTPPSTAIAETEEEENFKLAIDAFINAGDSDRLNTISNTIAETLLKNCTSLMNNCALINNNNNNISSSSNENLIFENAYHTCNMMISVYNNAGAVGKLKVKLPFIILLGKFFKFMLEKDEVDKNWRKKAGDIIYQLLSKEYAPKCYWAYLLKLSIPLAANSRKVIFCTEATFILLKTLSTLEQSYRKESLLKPLSESDIDNLRIMLANALGIAFTKQNSKLASSSASASASFKGLGTKNKNNNLNSLQNLNLSDATTTTTTIDDNSLWYNPSELIAPRLTSFLPSRN